MGLLHKPAPSSKRGIFSLVMQEIRQSSRLIYLVYAIVAEWWAWRSYLKNPSKHLRRAVQQACRRLPRYARFLELHGIRDLRSICGLSDFSERIPVVDRKMVFGKLIKDDLASLGPLPVAGFPSLLGAQPSLLAERGSNRRGIDLVLANYFEAHRRRTLLINALAWNYPMPSRLAAVVSTGVRADAVCAILQQFHSEFDQVLIAGDPTFLKRVVEQGVEGGVACDRLRVHLLPSGDSFSESWREYLQSILSVNTKIRGFMGLAEIGVSLFFETDETVRVRRLANEDPAVRRALFGPTCRVTPVLYHYDPSRIFVETGMSPEDPYTGELILSTLSRDVQVPLIRFNTREKGRVFAVGQLAGVLARQGYPSWVPTLPLPCVAAYGRGGNAGLQGTGVTPDVVKECLYREFDIAEEVTGNFRLSPTPSELRIDVQLKPRGEFHPMLARLVRLLGDYIEVPFRIRLFPYDQFPFNMDLDYERLSFIGRNEEGAWGNYLPRKM